MPEININNYARLIAQKLDSQDSNAGDNKIEASIWNKFVADKGGKTINNNITLDNAVKSISSYLANNAKSLGKSVEALAQEWLGGKPALNADNLAASLAENNQKDVKLETDPDKIKEKHEKAMAELKAKYNKTLEIAQKEKASNGLTYEKATDIMAEIRRKLNDISFVFIAKDENDRGSWHRNTDEEFITLLEQICNTQKEYSEQLKQLLQEFKNAYAAKKELEEKYPDLKNLSALKARIANSEYFFNIFEDAADKIREHHIDIAENKKDTQETQDNS